MIGVKLKIHSQSARCANSDSYVAVHILATYETPNLTGTTAS